MKLTLIPSSNFKPVQWSGGTTRQLFIYPPESQYKDLNFQFRISTATVETETSEFTSLPGVSRKLMVLSGQITIHHRNQHSRWMNPFDVDSFEGDWKTTSIGKCTDFNLMTTGKTSGNLIPLQVGKGQLVVHQINEKCSWLFAYLYTGNVTAKVNDSGTTVNGGDLLVCTHPARFSLEIEGVENSNLVIVEILE